MSPRIITHSHVDADAAASVWAVKKFVPDCEDSSVIFERADWNWCEVGKKDMIVDIRAGGRWIKGVCDASGKVHSAFASILTQFASEKERKALKDITEAIYLEDSTGWIMKTLCPEESKETVEIIESFGLRNIIMALRARHGNNDALICDRIGEILDGKLILGLEKIEVMAIAAEDPDIVTILEGGNVAVINGNKFWHLHDYMFSEKWVCVVVIKDGNNLLVLRKRWEKFNLDAMRLLHIIEDAGETISEEQWFSHSAGFMISWWSKAAPAKTSSKVDPMELAKAVNESFILKWQTI